MGLILKLDFEKAYDSISWDCLLAMLSRFGFGLKWREWIQECLYSSRISVLVNGSSTFEFTPEKGLRQGDPLSPFLFNLVAEDPHGVKQEVFAHFKKIFSEQWRTRPKILVIFILLAMVA